MRRCDRAGITTRPDHPWIPQVGRSPEGFRKRSIARTCHESARCQTGKHQRLGFVLSIRRGRTCRVLTKSFAFYGVPSLYYVAVSADFEELDYRNTPWGEVSLRRRTQPSLGI